eukprot:GABV01000041.1.p2 GENE.GABV01000041.1~~GABV01000041.1.p2  ORF type:complete len:281 (-),score=106.29 GABV01000041.1:36-878(-)
MAQEPEEITEGFWLPHFPRSLKSSKNPRPVVDLWWLTDDGGLSVLIPHLITLHKRWKNARVRVMNVSTTQSLSSEQATMTRLLSKLRIAAETIPIILDTDKRGRVNPPKDMVKKFSVLQKKRDLIEQKQEEEEKDQPAAAAAAAAEQSVGSPQPSVEDVAKKVVESELGVKQSQKALDTIVWKDGEEKESGPTQDEEEEEEDDDEWEEIPRSNRTNRQLAICGLIKEWSAESALAVVSIPVPEMKLDSWLYMSWLDMLSDIETPTILMRGTGATVLTWDL